MQYKNIENYDLVKEALIEANRRDLIGFGPECLIPPRPIGRNSNRTGTGSGNRNSVQANNHRSGRQSGEQRSKGNTRSNQQAAFSKGRSSRNGMTKGRPSNKSRGGR